MHKELNSSYMLNIIMSEKEQKLCDYYSAINKIVKNIDNELKQLYKDLTDTRNIRIIRYIDSKNRLELVHFIDCFAQLGNTFKNSVSSTHIKNCRDILTLKDSKTNLKFKI